MKTRKESDVTHALIEIVMDRLMYYQDIPVPYGNGEFRRRAVHLLEQIFDQMKKEEMELRRRVAAE